MAPFPPPSVSASTSASADVVAVRARPESAHDSDYAGWVLSLEREAMHELRVEDAIDALNAAVARKEEARLEALRVEWEERRAAERRCWSCCRSAKCCCNASSMVRSSTGSSAPSK